MHQQPETRQTKVVLKKNLPKKVGYFKKKAETNIQNSYI